MGLFTKKQSTQVETMDSTPADTRKAHRRRGKWSCGAKSSNAVIESKNSSYSTSSSSDDEKRDGSGHRNKSSGDRQQIDPRACLPPAAADSAFKGRPRFDWIDVEFHAATRIQTVFRRHMVLKQMEEAGKATSYSRNRKRQRRKFFLIDNSAAPDLGFGCCAMLPTCGNDYESDNIAFKEFQRRRYEEKTRAQKEREEFLSKTYIKKKGIMPRMKKLQKTKFRDESLM